jgi:hypothetical protein
MSRKTAGKMKSWTMKNWKMKGSVMMIAGRFLSWRT